MSRVLVFTNYGGPDNQEVIDRPIPAPGPGEIAIQVKAAGVNPIDWKTREGRHGRDGALPVAMGREASGIVTAVGEGVEGFAVGDAVLGRVAAGHGAIAEETVLSAENTVLKPDEISFADAAALPIAGATAYDLTHQIELEPGQTMLILGAGGGVGLMCAQIGKVHGFTVIGVASASKRELVESTGAHFVESGPGAADRVRDIAPDGADLLLDLVGGDALRDLAPAVKDPSLIITAADATTATELGGVLVTRTAEGLRKITDVVAYGLVDPHVGERFSLADASAALAVVESGHATGKIIVEP